MHTNTIAARPCIPAIANSKSLLSDHGHVLKASSRCTCTCTCVGCFRLQPTTVLTFSRATECTCSTPDACYSDADMSERMTRSKTGKTPR